MATAREKLFCEELRTRSEIEREREERIDWWSEQEMLGRERPQRFKPAPSQKAPTPQTTAEVIQLKPPGAVLKPVRDPPTGPTFEPDPVPSPSTPRLDRAAKITGIITG